MAKKKTKKRVERKEAVIEDLADEQVSIPSRPTQVTLTNRQKKRRVFLGDAIRDE